MALAYFSWRTNHRRYSDLMEGVGRVNPFEGYRITSPYGWRKSPITSQQEFHTGIDLVKAHQAPIYAFVAGVVTHAKLGVTGSGFGNYGIVVAIKDVRGHLHCYAHLDMALVKVGQQVEKGQVIGRQGNTGQSTGSHLHYEIRKTSSPSFGWIADRANNCFEPTQYLIDLYESMALEQRLKHEERPSDWAVNWNQAIKDGVTDGTRPKEYATREEIIEMIYRSKGV